MNEFIHYRDRDDHTNHTIAYKDYYRELLEKNTDKSILYYFPNPDFVKFRFSFRKFFIGVVGRIMCNTEYLYGDPITWDLAYYIDPSENKVWIRRYILLDNYNEFLLLDLFLDGPTTVNEHYVIYRAIGEEREIEFEVITYRPLDVISRLEQRRNSDEFENLEPHVEAVCNNIYELRRKDFQEKPLYLYIDELKEKFEEEF